MEEKLYCHYLNKKGNIKTVEMSTFKKDFGTLTQNYYECFYGINGYKRIKESELNKVFDNTFEGCVGVFTKDKKPHLSVCLITDYLKKEKENKQKKYEEKINKLNKKIKTLEEEYIERED